MDQRYYCPEGGLFLSTDPVSVFASGDAKVLNRYAYAFNNPYRFIDPGGRYTCDVSVCKNVQGYLAKMIKSRDSFKKDSAEKKIVDAVVLGIGAEGDPGPHYTGGELNGNRAASSDQQGHITLDLKKIPDSDVGAAVIGHEEQHDIDVSINGIANTEQDVRTSEINAYTTEEIISNGLGIKYKDGELKNAVERSVKNWKGRQQPQPPPPKEPTQ